MPLPTTSPYSVSLRVVDCRRRLRAQLGTAGADSALLSHTLEEVLDFDRRLDRDAGYAECPGRFPGQTWPR